MVKTVEEALALYKAELVKYRDWTNERKACYASLGGDPQGSMEDVMGLWSQGDYSQIMSWDAKLQAMQHVLGLTEEEVREIDDEVGITIQVA